MASLELTRNSAAVVLRQTTGQVVLPQPSSSRLVIATQVVLGGGNVSTDESVSVDGHIAVMDGTTGKKIRDGGALTVETTGDIVLAVSTTGTDRTQTITNGDYTSTPFLTIDGALDALPRFNIHTVIINVGAGTFAKWIPRPFVGGGTERIIGYRAIVTPSSGVSSGTAGTGTGIDGVTGVSTIVKPTGAPDWPSDNSLRGKFIVVTGGAGFLAAPVIVIGCIKANTTTQLEVAMLAGVGLATSDSNFVIEAIDDTTTWEIVSMATSITVDRVGDTQMKLVGCQGVTSVECMSFGGAGDQYGSVFYPEESSEFHIMACSMDFTGNQNYGAFCVAVGELVFVACYVNGGSFCDASANTVVAYGCVGDNCYGFQVYATLAAYGAYNWIDNASLAGAQLWSLYNCGSFFDYASVASNCIASAIISAVACAQLQLNVMMATGTCTGYGMAISGPCVAATDSKAFTGDAGDVLLDDTVVSIQAAAYGDVFVRDLCELIYVGS